MKNKHSDGAKSTATNCAAIRKVKSLQLKPYLNQNVLRPATLFGWCRSRFVRNNWENFMFLYRLLNELKGFFLVQKQI
jgi:hypothetical protein